jgi:hypothetical protein
LGTPTAVRREGHDGRSTAIPAALTAPSPPAQGREVAGRSSFADCRRCPARKDSPRTTKAARQSEICRPARRANGQSRTQHRFPGRRPRRYRGKNVTTWLDESGYLDRTPDQLPTGASQFDGNQHVSGKAGGHTLNLHLFARDGVTLLGHLRDADSTTISLAPDLHENLAKRQPTGTTWSK